VLGYELFHNLTSSRKFLSCRKVQTDSGAHPNSYPIFSYGFPLGVKRTCGVKVATHFCLVSSLGMCGVVPTITTLLHIEHRDKFAWIVLKLLALCLLLSLLGLISSSCCLGIVSFVGLLLLQFLSSSVLLFLPNFICTSPLIRWICLSVFCQCRQYMHPQTLEWTSTQSEAAFSLKNSIQHARLKGRADQNSTCNIATLILLCNSLCNSVDNAFDTEAGLRVTLLGPCCSISGTGNGFMSSVNSPHWLWGPSSLLLNVNRRICTESKATLENKQPRPLVLRLRMYEAYIPPFLHTPSLFL